MTNIIAFNNPALGDALRNARLAAIGMLLAIPDDIPDGLESELYAFRDIITGVFPHLRPE